MFIAKIKNTKGQSNEKSKTSIFQVMLTLTVTMIAVIVVFQMVPNNVAINPVSTSNLSARVDIGGGGVGGPREQWREYPVWDILFGRREKSTLHTIYPGYPTVNTVFENWRAVLDVTNYTDVTQSAQYSYSETKGHEVSAEITAKFKHFEAAVGYTFNFATTTGYTANVDVPAGKRVLVCVADSCIKMQYCTYRVQPQKLILNYPIGSKWVDNGDPEITNPCIKEYGCAHIEWSNLPCQ